jgi:hypothetical protein
MTKFVAMTLDIYDFLQLFFCGLEDVTTFGAQGLAAASIAAQALTNLLGTRGRKKEAKRMMRQGEKQFDEYTQKLLDLGAKEQKVDQGVYDLENTIRGINEAARDRAQDQANRVEASLVRAAGANPRSAANVTEMLTNLGRGTDAAIQDTYQGDIAAQANTLAQEQAVDQDNFSRLFDMEKFIYGTGMERAAASAEAGRQQLADVQAIRQSTLPDALLSTSKLLEAFEASKGGVLKAKAGAAFVTPGEFSHETNPQNVRAEEGKMIFENKRGEDIAEVTGQEIVVKDKGKEEGVVVIDPNTAVSMEELVESGDKEGLFEFFKNFFMKKKEEQEQHEGMKAEMEQQNG